MRNLTPAQFSDFFEAVHSTEAEPRRPFEWQKRLAAEVLDNGWHDVVRVPTGCGKTAVLDLAVFELALQADRTPRDRTAPRRICLVVDRRLVVDEATEHARRILRAIRRAPRNPHAAPVLKAVSDRLRALAPAAGKPLRLVRLRGGVYRDDGWASDPLTPTIIVSTVDQIGSRLLFRGYGVSRRNLPVHAGLLAFDTRVIVDEAHLSTVFTETLDLIRCYQHLAERSLLPENRRLSIVRMSATVREHEDERPFKLSPQEREDPELRSRLEARKEASLIPVQVDAVTEKMRREQRGKARQQEKENRKELIKKIVNEARSLAGVGNEEPHEPRPRVIGVIVNRVATARQVYEILSDGDGLAHCEAFLLTGRIRPFDRDRLIENWLPRVKAGRKQEPEKTLFVVATQTVEVGANLDFDALVTEAAPFDALRQRFGRLDRLGRRHERGVSVPASIVICTNQARKSDDDLVYGAAIAETWQWLKQKIATSVGTGAAKRSTVDFGSNRLDERVSRHPPEDLPKVLTQPSECPRLFPAHLDAWVQTNPRPEPDPDVAPFLHLIASLGLAGRWHDEGKRDMRFQAWLRGSELKALAANEPLAKSGRDQYPPSRIFGYPLGARHEFVSVRLFEEADLQCAGRSFNLVKFIIGTHHGFGRPFPPVDRDTKPIRVKLVRSGQELVVSSNHRLHLLGSGWVDLFWSMVRRFGWWGIAYLEALLVTADRTVSARKRSRQKAAEEDAA